MPQNRIREGVKQAKLEVFAKVPNNVAVFIVRYCWRDISNDGGVTAKILAVTVRDLAHFEVLKKVSLKLDIPAVIWVWSVSTSGWPERGRGCILGANRRFGYLLYNKTHVPLSR